METPDFNKPDEIKNIYKSCFPQVLSMVIKNSGSTDDAHEVFQEAMLVLYKKWKAGNLTLTASVCTYLQSIAWRKWMNELKRLGKTKSNAEIIVIPGEHSILFTNENEERKSLLITCINKLGEKCKNIISLFLDDTPGEEIAKQLGYSTYEYYRVAKKRCLDNLKELMRSKTMQ